jgi:cytochrome c oxidase subunit 2
MHPLLLLASNDWGSPHGVTAQDSWTRELWKISYYFAIPIGVLVIFLITWSLVRHRARPGHDRTPAQFQYHIPLEFTYTIIPLIVVAIIFGFMFNAENHQGAVSSHPALKVEVDGFQWGWRFKYPDGHSEVGTGDEQNVNDNQGLPTLYLPANETVELHVVSLDVVHTFYVPEFLYNRDLIPGVDNKFDVDVKTPGLYPGQCNNICGQYHAYMRFLVDVMPPSQFNTWYQQNQPPPGSCSVTTASPQGPHTTQGKCDNIVPGLEND